MGTASVPAPAHVRDPQQATNLCVHSRSQSNTPQGSPAQSNSHNVASVHSSTPQLQKQLVSLLEFIAGSRNKINAILSKGYVPYSQLQLLEGHFDFMQYRKETLEGYCHVLTKYGLDYRTCEQIVADYLLRCHAKYISKTDKINQVADVSRYLINIYLNCRKNGSLG